MAIGDEIIYDAMTSENLVEHAIPEKSPTLYRQTVTI